MRSKGRHARRARLRTTHRLRRTAPRKSIKTRKVAGKITRKRNKAFKSMLDRIWAQKVVKNEAPKGSNGRLSKGFAGSVKLVNNTVVKTVSPELDSTFGWKVGKAEMKRLFRQEVSIQREVSRIAPGLTPKVLGYDSKKLTFSMEFFPGKHLYEITRKDLNPGALGRFEKKLARVHRAGIGHGDIKPANIMIIGGEMKLIDWGAGRHRLNKGGKETVMDHFLRRTMGHPGAVNLIAFDHQAMKRVHKALNQLPAGPASRVAAKTSR